LEGRDRRRLGIRKRIRGTAERPRLSVFRGNRNMHCQIIDDDAGATIVSVSSVEERFREATGSKSDLARLLGAELAKRAKEQGVNKVVFDRGGYKYHGRVAALAEAAREEGLGF